MTSSTAGTRAAQQSVRGLPSEVPSPPAVRRLPVFTLASDFVWLCVAVSLAALGASTHVGLLPGDLSDPAPTLLAAGPAMVLGCVVVIALSGGYAASVLGAGRAEFQLVRNAIIVAAALVGISCS